MERSGASRWVFLIISIGVLVLLAPRLFGDKEDAATQPLTFEWNAAPKKRAPEQLCDIWTERFRAQLTSRGASLKHYELLTAKYRADGKPTDLSTTPELESRRQLRFEYRNEAAGKLDDPWLVQYDLLDWKLEKADGKSCTFKYEDERVELTNVISATARPYELAVKSTVKNTGSETRPLAVTVETDAWRTSEEVAGKMFRVSPFITQVECVNADGESTRLQPTDFEPDEFTEPEFAPNGLNPGDWYQVSGQPAVVAVSNAYFTNSVIPMKGQGEPVCQLQAEARGKSNDPNAGHVYRGRIAYPKTDLKPGATTTYEVLSYVGPKERDVLASSAGGNHQVIELIDLGFFSIIAKVLVGFLLKVYSVIPNWGLAIIILTVCARMLLFPLAWPSIKNMVRMRQLKPEMDALNEKYKDDAKAKGLAQMELWRKHGVNPFKGCLPQMASMPVWFALYTTLQTAVELYNIPFLWFPDLSKPDGFYILPFIIGLTYFAQQKLMPQQGDPMQQKMMMYFMPGMFTVFMLFLPSGLGVYMFTNSLLGIVQHQVVEWHVRRSTKAEGDGDINVSVKDDGAAPKKSKKDKLSESGPLLGKGKA